MGWDSWTSHPNTVPRILIADDQADVLQALRLLLKSEGFETATASSPAGVLAAVERDDYDAVLMDLNYQRDTTSAVEGLDLLSRLHLIDPTLPVVVMTAWGTVDKAVEAMRRGARDFIEKPWDNTRLVATLRTQVALAGALRKTERLESENLALRPDRPSLIAESKAMQPVLELMARVAASDAPVLITGEHGTGKEEVARWLHAESHRASMPLITVNVGGLSDGVFESELFGHMKGAFTDAKADRVGRFELAHRGTLFLDEIANIAPNQQAKLLRVLQTGELERVGSSKTRHVDVRILSATNADPRQEVRAGRFREDLLFRLNTVEIRLPPLRDRPEDVPLLARHFLARHTERYGKRIDGFDAAALDALVRHAWPGNVRELDHVVERAILLARGPVITPSDLALSRTDEPAGDLLTAMTLNDAEAVLIRRALERAGGNVTEAAKALGLSRSALYRRLQRIEP